MPESNCPMKHIAVGFAAGVAVSVLFGHLVCTTTFCKKKGGVSCGARGATGPPGTAGGTGAVVGLIRR